MADEVKNQDLTVFVVNFNTTDMTNACIDRVLQHCGNYHFKIIVLDNSTTDKFVLYSSSDKIKVVDNTKNQIIDYVKFVENFCRGNDPGDYASPKHAAAIDWMISVCPTDDLLILDSDAFLIKDVDFVNDRFCTICEIGDSFGNKRVLPMIQYINVKSFKENGLRFYDPHRFRYSLDPRYVLWDTGTCLLYDIVMKRLPIGQIHMSDYVHHLGGASWEQIRTGKDFAFDRNRKFMEENK